MQADSLPAELSGKPTPFDRGKMKCGSACIIQGDNTKSGAYAVDFPALTVLPTAAWIFSLRVGRRLEVMISLTLHLCIVPLGSEEHTGKNREEVTGIEIFDLIPCVKEGAI